MQPKLFFSTDLSKFSEVIYGADVNRPDKEGRTPYVWAQGVFLATNSPVAKPSTMALLDRLTNGEASKVVKP